MATASSLVYWHIRSQRCGPIRSAGEYGTLPALSKAVVTAYWKDQVQRWIPIGKYMQHVPSGSAGEEHDGPDGPLSQCLENTGGLAAPANSVASSFAPHETAVSMALDNRPPTSSGAKASIASFDTDQEENAMGASGSSGLLRSSSGESLSALERVSLDTPVARTLQRGPNPTATSGGSKSSREVFAGASAPAAGAPPEKGNKAPGAPALSPQPQPQPKPEPAVYGYQFRPPAAAKLIEDDVFQDLNKEFAHESLRCLHTVARPGVRSGTKMWCSLCQRW
eukprot:COSAG06_NODE_59_length_27189_cov_21.724527_4_plen_280_part_00